MTSAQPESILLRRSRCPRCKKEGRDTRKDNLAEYSDGHRHCFSCGFHVFPSLNEQLHSKLNRTQSDNPKPKYPSMGLLSFDLPSVAQSWLSSYGITADEIRTYKIMWNPERLSLVFPILDVHTNQIIATNERYFGENPKHPKYITTGPIHQYPTIFGRNNVCVLVEDFVSSIKVARQFQAIPLFGSKVSTPLLLGLIGKVHTLRVWLDRDKAKEAIQIAARARQFMGDCGTIVTEKDPKAYTDQQIKEYVLVVPDSTQGISCVFDVPKIQ